jgi:hypothetical protein
LGISALHSAALADLTFTVVQDIGSVLSSERSSAWAPAKPHPYTHCSLLTMWLL